MEPQPALERPANQATLVMVPAEQDAAGLHLTSTRVTSPFLRPWWRNRREPLIPAMLSFVLNPMLEPPLAVSASIQSALDPCEGEADIPPVVAVSSHDCHPAPGPRCRCCCYSDRQCLSLHHHTGFDRLQQQPTMTTRDLPRLCSRDATLAGTTARGSSLFLHGENGRRGKEPSGHA